MAKDRLLMLRSELDKLECAHPDHSPEACSNNRVLSSSCHPGLPTWAVYDRNTGVLTIICAKCLTPIVAVPVADVPAGV